MADDISFSEDFLAEVQQLNTPGTEASRQAAEQELAGLDLYQVAANSKEDRDPKYVGKIEGLLRSNNTEGLRAYLGESKATQVQEAYNAAWRQVEQDRGLPRTTGEAIRDTAVGIPATIAQGLLGMEAAVMGSPVGQFLLEFGGIGGGPGSFADFSGQYAPVLAEQNKQLAERVIDPLYSGTLKNQRRLVGLLDREDERDHRLQAEDAADAARGEFLPTLGAWTGRIARDAVSGAANTLSNPVVATQGTTDAIGSMVLAGGVTRGLGALGEKVVAQRSAQILEQQLAKGVERTVAERVAAEGVEALQKRLGNASAMAGVGGTEAAGAYQQQAERVMATSLDDLTRTSQPFRDEVARLQAEGVPFEDAEIIARRTVANQSGQDAAGKTGVVAAGIGHFLPEGAQSPFSTVRGFATDAAREGVEELLQGGTGQLVGNAAQQAYVDPEQDVLTGVGTQAGAGGVLGVASSGVTRAPSAATQVASAGRSQAREVVAKRADAARAKLDAESPASVQGLVKRTQDLTQDRTALDALRKAAQESLTEDEAGNARLQTQLQGLVNSGVVFSLPGSASALSTEDQGKFTAKQTRATAVDTAARLLLAEEDPKKAAPIAQLFSDLMEPVRQYGAVSGELGRLASSQEGSQALARYQGVLSDIAALPSVQKASQRLVEVLAQGPRTPQALGAMATVDPGLGGSVKAQEVRDVLTHATAGAELTEAQRTALRGSLALLQARESLEASRDPDASQELLERHLGGDRNAPTTGRQATVELNPVHLNDDKYSARGHVDRVIRVMMTGDLDEAKTYMHEFGNFVQHFQNKVGALNRSAQRDGERVSYQQYVGRGSFLDSEKNPKNYKHKTLFLNRKSQASIRQAESIGQEAALMGALYEGLRQAYPELNEREISRQSLELAAPAAEPRRSTRFSEQVSRMGLRERARLVGIDYVTGLRTRQAWEESPRSGQKVMVLTSTAVKPINDDPFGGHDVTNDLLRVMGTAIGKIDPNAARGGTNFILETDRDAQDVLDEVRRSLPDEAIELAYGEGATLEDAFQDESRRTEGLRREGKLPERGQTAFDLRKLEGMKFAKPRAQERLSQQTVDRVRKLSDREFEEQVLMDPVTPGVLSGTGWRSIPRKAFVASLDLKGLKKLNDLISKEFGNLYLKTFSEVGLKVGGAALDFAHLSGDEYAVQADTREEVQAFLNKLEKYLQDNVQLEATNDETGVTMEVVPAFRQGIGATYGEADRVLNTAKRAELAAAAAAQTTTEGVSGGVRADPDRAAGEVEADGPQGRGQVSTAQEVEAVPAVPQTTAERFPNLYQVPGKVRNFFAQGLKLRPGSTRTMGTDHPVSAVVNAINAQNGIREFTGKEPRGTLTPEVVQAYRGYLHTAARNVASALNQSLVTFLKSNYSKGLTMEQALRDGTHELTVMQRGKVLNLVELKQDGNFGYNSALMEGAILAALQWQLSANQRQPESRPDEVAQELGFRSAEDVPGDLITQMKAGQNLAQAKQSMTNYIKRFWGVRPDPEAPMGFSEAIIEAMASEALLALEKAKLLQVNKVTVFYDEDGELVYPYRGTDYKKDKLTPETYDRYVTVDSDSPLNSYPELLEEMVVVEPEFASYYGDAVPPVSDRLLSNSQVRLSEATKTALANMQSQQFYLNMPLVEGVLALGAEGLVDLFGNRIPSNAQDNYNKIHLESLESQNQSLRGSYKELTRLVAEMRNQAGDSDVGQLAKKYQYAVNSVNRIMMLGAHNPQASKLMREMILPTWSTLDLTDQSGPHYRYFMQAFAQTMGQKVHQRSLEENVKWSREAISGSLAPVVSVLSSWLQGGGAFPAAAYKQALATAGVENTPLAAMALTEVARMQSADLRAFRTPLYLESDGMTNGPFNSMGLLAVGEVTEQDVQNWRRGGLSVGSEPRTADQLRKSVGKTDLYKEGMNAAQEDVNDQLRSIQKQKNKNQVLGVAKAMFTAMELLLDGEVSWDADRSEWQFERGLGKNPSTVLVYGAGNPGIANKLVSRVTGAFYEKLSAVSKVGGTWEEAALEMFPSDSPAQAVYKADQLRRAMDVLAGLKVVSGVRGFYLAEKAQEKTSVRVDASPQKFEFNKSELKRMQDNMLVLLVNPMKSGIRRVLGPSVFESGDLLVKATQLQSTVAREVYLKAVGEALEKRVRALAEEYGDEKRARSEVASSFLPRAEMEKIWDDFRDVMPLVEADGQQFLISKTALLNVGAKHAYEYSRALDDSLRTKPYVEGIAPAGVNARPYLTIGMGDARMVRKAYERGLPGSMQVFDGINLRVDKIPEYGSRINQAALQAWQGDVFGAVNETFLKFVAHPKVQEIFKDEEVTQRLLKEKVNVGEWNDIRSELAAHVTMQRARNKAFGKFDLSMDQMAGTYQPYVRRGGIDLSNATDAEVADAINAEYQNALKVPELRVKTEAPKVQGVIHSSGASVYTRGNMGQYLRWLAGKVTKEESEVLREIFKSGNLKNTRIVVGTPAQVRAFQDAEALSSSLVPLQGQGKEINGYYHPVEDVIYLLNGNVETAVHEIVHAGTYKTVLAHYQGRPVKSAQSIRELEKLMHLFLSEELAYTGDAEVALGDARVAINSNAGPTPENRANMLNEFMAWNLANRALVTEQSKADNALTKLAKVLKSAFDAMVRLMTGKEPTNKGSDFSAQVRFNTAQVAREPTVESMVASVTLAHATVAGVESNRLTRLADAFGQKVARYLASNPGTMAESISDPLALAKDTAARAREAFGLGDQASDTFQMMVLAFATEASVNPQSMIEAQELYSHFLRGLKQGDFLTGLGDEMNDRAQAKEKFDFISGHTQSSKEDPSGRSTLLPSFLALAAVDDGFRSVLGGKSLPEKVGKQVVGLDSALEVAGQRVMDALSDRLTGQDHPVSVLGAIDQLTQGIVETTQSSILAMADKLSGTNFLGSMNDKLSDMLDRAGKAAGRTGRVLGRSENPISRGAATVLKTVSILASSEDAAVAGEEVLRQMDKHPNIASFFKDVVADMIGRTKSQADVYDMVKRVRKLVSQTRQAYRENLPQTILKQFTREPTARQWDLLWRVAGRYDLASLTDTRTPAEVLALASDGQALSQEVSRIEAVLGQDAQGQRYLDKVGQYVDFVLTGRRGTNLLRNAYAISELLGEDRGDDFAQPTEETVRDIDQLITLKLLEQVPEKDREQFSRLVADEPRGLEFTLNYLSGQRKTELSKATQGMAKFNHYKGVLPSEFRGRGHVVVEYDARSSRMLEMGYERRGPYRGSSVESRDAGKSYWYSPEGGVKTTFNQGIAQNVQGTAYGVRTENGTSLDGTAGLITDPAYVEVLRKRLSREAPGSENLSPIYDDTGALFAFERSLDPEQTRVLQGEQHLAKMIGEWRGRQVEESWSEMVNRELLNHLHSMYQGDPNKDRYVNLLDKELEDPVLKDAVSIMPRELKAQAEELFGRGQFMVRRNLLNSVVGYRNASVGDLWTGTSRWSPKRQEQLKQALMAIPGLGRDAYRRLVWAERNWQAAMAAVRTNIVVRSLVVPAANFVSGVMQLSVRGVSLTQVLKSVPAKVLEVEYYSKTMARKIELEAERFASESDVTRVRKIDAQLTALDDSLRRLSIWPLIEAGEFSTISDVGQTAESLGAGEGTLVERLTQAVDQLPPGLRDLARQGYMARDTALFQAMQKATQYSDFIMKAIYFDHLKGEGQSTRAALANVTEEFNNYDVPPGRDRGYVESVGLAWFLNYKIRATKVGLSMVRKNPLNMLLYTMVPHPVSTGIPGTDNLVSSLMELSLGRSFGPGMATSPIALNPWYNLFSN